MTSYPVLYSFVRCPYAMRARLALLQHGISYNLREVNLKEKPNDMLTWSPKGTVPVMLLEGNKVIDESLDIVNWAFSHDKSYQSSREESEQINRFQADFIHYVYRFKYPERYEDISQADAKEALQAYLISLVPMLEAKGYLYAGEFSKAEAVMLPFVRQMYIADPEALAGSKLMTVKAWLEARLTTKIFVKAMYKAEVWSAASGNQVLIEHETS